MTHIEYLESMLNDFKDFENNCDDDATDFWKGAVFALKIVIKELKIGVDN